MNNTTQSRGGCIAGIVDIEGVYHLLATADYIMIVFTLISSILQIYIIRSALSHLQRKASDECLHLFLLSMTAGDLILTGVCYPLEYFQRVELIHVVPQFVNILMHFFTWVALSASSISLILLNVDKLLFFKYPLRYTTVVSRSRGIAIVALVWFGCFTFVLAAWRTGCFKCADERCFYLDLLEGNTGAMYVAFSISVCILPTVTSLAVAIYILKIVMRHKKQLSEEQHLFDNTNHVHETFASRLRTFYFIFMTTIFTACTLLPYRIVNMKRTLFVDNSPKECVTILWWWITLYLVQLNAIVNPLITVTVLPQYRARICRRLFGLSDGSEPTKALTGTHL